MLKIFIEVPFYYTTINKLDKTRNDTIFNISKVNLKIGY
jgi:hypothetical protein